MTKIARAKWFAWLVVVGALAATFSLGFYFGTEQHSAEEKVTTLVGKEAGRPSTVDFSPFWQAWNILDEKYVADNGNSSTTKETTDQERVWGAIAGLTNSLDDPYTIFLPPEEKKKFEEEISGNFSGVGMEIGIKDDVLTVVAPLPNSPAKRAGVQAGDKILKIDDKLSSNLSTDEAVNLIRGPEGTVVRLTLFRGAETSVEKTEPFEVSITRDVIIIPTIDTKETPEGVYVIRLYNFSAVSPNLFRDALRGFVESKKDKLVIDLRGNPGGFLDAAVDMASWFLPVGKPVVVEKHGGETEDRVYRSRGYDIFTDNLKMVILIDRGSASASEILAGALSEYGKAILVGEKTFGKGSVQELIPLEGGSSLKVTIAKWYTPKDHSISLNGLQPDVAVAITEEDFKAGRDPQLDKAIEILLKK
ncbi:MAG TPA: S41 family peptidase [Candidatus Paceibacterota bacterium]|nr:S41 family peptidase [Candidatus Paceibacterota bacterium]